MTRHFELRIQEQLNGQDERSERPVVANVEGQASERPIMPVWWRMVLEDRGYLEKRRRAVSYRLLGRVASCEAGDRW